MSAFSPLLHRAIEVSTELFSVQGFADDLRKSQMRTHSSYLHAHLDLACTPPHTDTAPSPTIVAISGAVIPNFTTYLIIGRIPS